MLLEETWYSIGGGFIVRDGDETAGQGAGTELPYPYRNAAELLALCAANSLTIADLVLANETALRPEAEVLDGIDRIAAVMFDCIERGIRGKGELPGALKVQRRANGLFERLRATRPTNVQAPHEAMEFVNVYAIAVNEENAAGGPRRHRADQRRRRRHPGRAALLSRSLPGRLEAGIVAFLADCDRNRRRCAR